jgi:L-fucose isomerase-like protein
MNDTRIVTIGYLFGGMSLGDMDLTKMKREFGPELVELDAYSLIHRMEAVDTSSDVFVKNKKEIEKVLGAPLGSKIENINRMYTVLKEIIEENHAQALTIKCHFELSQQYGLTACIPLSVLGNKVVASCEADMPVVLSQLLFHYLSGGEITTYADVHEILGDRILVAACGFAPGGMCINNKVIPDMPSSDPEGLGATFGDYITNKNYLKEGSVTVGRILKDPDGGFTLHTTKGNAIGDVGRVSEIGCPQYPFTEILLASDVDSFAQNMGSHHYALVYDDIAEGLEMFCKIKGIRFLSEKTP